MVTPEVLPAAPRYLKKPTMPEGINFSSASDSRPHHNLPLALTSFVGREQEMAEVKRLLDTNRLLTLTGPGGSGKTRLALTVASDMTQHFEDGVWMMELAPLSNPDLVPQAMASVLGVREVPGTPLTNSLCVHLESRKTLLVLDNCEHLVEACADLVATLLRFCPNLRILSTSREMLGVPGETLFAVPPLSLPDPHHLSSLGNHSNDEASELFVERARAIRSDFALTEGNVMAVAQVCYQLDGIPLAIELAAARVRVLSVEQISSRLKESFALLSGGVRTAMPRHRTLRATMDWSHELLSREERILLRRFSVFAGGFTLEAAEAVCAGGTLGRGEVLDLLSSLVDKSLVLVTGWDGEPRHRLLETVRQYGREKLEESGEEDEIRRRHALFFLALAEEVEPKINTAGRRQWMERLENEHDNLRTALAWSSTEETRGETGLRLAGALLWFWFHHGYLDEGRRWLGGALSTEEGAGGRPAPASPAARAKALCGAGLLAWMQGDQAEASSRLGQSVTLWRELEDKQGLAQALRILGHVMLGQGASAVARSLGEESVELFRESKDEFGLATSLATLGIIALTQEDYVVVQASLEESVAICRESGDDWALSLALRNLGIAALKQGDYEQAAAWVGESVLALQEPAGALGMVNLDLLAAAVSLLGDHEWATRLFGAAEAVRETVGVPVIPSIRADYDRGLAAARAGLGGTTFAAAWAEGKAMPPEQAIEYALEPPMVPEQASPSTYPASLSARETEVLRLVAKGMTNAQIARELFISPRTVNAHLGSIYHKIGSSTRAEATRFAIEHGLL